VLLSTARALKSFDALTEYVIRRKGLDTMDLSSSVAVAATLQPDNWSFGKRGFISLIISFALVTHCITTL
jgi:hypothetical protein